MAHAGPQGAWNRASRARAKDTTSSIREERPLSVSTLTIIGVLVALALIALIVPGGVFVLIIGVIALLVYGGYRYARRDTLA
jgi:hypothetical protein